VISRPCLRWVGSGVVATGDCKRKSGCRVALLIHACPVSQDRVEALIEEHEAAVGGTPEGAAAALRLAAEGRKPRALPAGALSQLLKSALALEMEAGAAAERIGGCLRASRWRQSAAAALKDGRNQSGAAGGMRRPRLLSCDAGQSSASLPSAWAQCHMSPLTTARVSTGGSKTTAGAPVLGCCL